MSKDHPDAGKYELSVLFKRKDKDDKLNVSYYIEKVTEMMNWLITKTKMQCWPKVQCLLFYEKILIVLKHMIWMS